MILFQVKNKMILKESGIVFPPNICSDHYPPEYNCFIVYNILIIIYTHIFE